MSVLAITRFRGGGLSFYNRFPWIIPKLTKQLNIQCNQLGRPENDRRVYVSDSAEALYKTFGSLGAQRRQSGLLDEELIIHCPKIVREHGTKNTLQQKLIITSANYRYNDYLIRRRIPNYIMSTFIDEDYEHDQQLFFDPSQYKLVSSYWSKLWCDYHCKLVAVKFEQWK